MPSPRRRTAVIAAGAVVVLAAGGAGAVVLTSRAADADRDAAAADAATAVADAWSRGELADAAVVSPDGGDAAAVAASYEAVVAGMGGLVPAVEVTGVERDAQEGRTASADLSVTWPVGDGWTSTTTLPLEVASSEADGREVQDWAATWAPAVLSSELGDGDVLQLQRVRGERGGVLDRDGEPLVTDQPVVDVQVDPAGVEDVDALAAEAADVLGVDGASLAERVAAAPAGQAVPVITLRQAAFDAVSGRLEAIAGIQTPASTLPLAPTADFARGLLGTLGQATAELVEESQGRLQAGDVTGLSGVQLQYDERLAGTPGATVVRVPAGAAGAGSTQGQEAPAGTEPEAGQTLYSTTPVPGEPVQLSLDPDVQLAADAALAGAGDATSALVAVDVGSGDLLAVSTSPSAGGDRALTGQYAPGSTFKAVTTQALLASGLSPDDVVDCPATAEVDGRSYRNAEGGELGPVPFAEDFAQSCNTAFVSLRDRLAPTSLAEAAGPMGIGGDWEVGVPLFTGDVPETESEVDLASSMIGQGRVLASPAAMAVATSTIARGQWLAPRVVLDPAPQEVAAPGGPVADLSVVRDLMRGVVTGGSATVLGDVPGEPVSAKTGTAEVGAPGADGALATNAWTVAFQPGTGPAGPDGAGVAVAVLVEGGSAGGAVAAPVVRDLLTALAG